MKLILSFLLIPALAFGQDCKLKKEIDPFSQQAKLTTGFFPVGSNRLSITADSKEIDFFFVLGGNKCFDDATTVTVNFEGDRLKSNFRSSGTMNCEGLYHFTLRNTPLPQSALQRMATKKVVSIKFVNGKTITDVNLDDAQKDLLMKWAGCMLNEAKTLIR